jgi:phospholipase/carboxylesterase
MKPSVSPGQGPRRADDPATPASAPPASGHPGDGWTRLTAGTSTGLLYAPRYPAAGAVRLVVLFHGAGQSPRKVQGILGQHARQEQFALLLPQSASATWDAVHGQADSDLAGLEDLLAAVAGRVPIDPNLLGVAGFSDGASYALGIGIASGDRFQQIMAFSPGFVARTGPPSGAPRIFVSHGRNDTVLPIARTSRRLVPALRAAGYSVRYDEFDGGHTVPGSVADAAVGWLTAGHIAPAAAGEPGQPGGAS